MLWTLETEWFLGTHTGTKKVPSITEQSLEQVTPTIQSTEDWHGKLRLNPNKGRKWHPC